MRGVTKMVPVSPPRAWVEIDLAALRHNFRVAKEMAGCRLMAVVKAAAYGHGLEEVTRCLEGEGVEFFGVANVGEARRIAHAGVKTRIYLLGAAWSEEREEIVSHGWTPCLSTIQEARHFNELAADAGVKLRAHLAVDTGMGRGGFLPAGLAGVMRELDSLEHLVIEGIGSHLPSADEDEEFTLRQIAEFAAAISAAGGERRFPWRHLANSAGMMAYSLPECNLARPGLMLYGISPVPGYQDKLRVAMTLKSRITLVRTLPAGHGVSYGREFVTARPTRVATVGIGYADGYPRHLSGKGAEVWVRGRRMPVIGRVTMDQVMVDATDASDVCEGDEVELFGSHILADEVARKAGTIPWELLTGITPRVIRVHLEHSGGG